MTHRDLRARRIEPEPGSTFLAESIHAESVVGMAAGRAPDALVHLTLAGRWNRGARDRIHVIISPDTARELGDLTPAADAAESDLARYLAGESMEQIQRSGDAETTSVAVKMPSALFDAIVDRLRPVAEQGAELVLDDAETTELARHTLYAIATAIARAGG